MKNDKHEEAGLVFSGINEDGEKEWIGTDKEWNRYSELIQENDDWKDEIEIKCDMCNKFFHDDELHSIGGKLVCIYCQATFE